MIQMEVQFGYFGEDKITDFFTMDKYRFHIYDENKKEYAHTDQKILSWLYQNEIKDTSNNIVYKIDKDFTLVTDEYTITKVSNSDVTMDKAIFLTCIIDAIIDKNG